MRVFAASLVCLSVAFVSPARSEPIPEKQVATKIGPRLRKLAGNKTWPRDPLPVITVWRSFPAKLANGFAPEACVGRVCVVRLAPGAVASLAAEPGLVSARLPVPYRMRLDKAGPSAGLPQARADSGLTGKGVLVAVIDTGLDWSHPDFIDSEGRTRVAWLLDQTRPALGRHQELESIGNGAVFSAEEIQAALEGFPGPAMGAGADAIGHGTHVAGIAVGDDPVYTGAAPEARLVVVKAVNDDLSGFDEDRLLAALAFADRAARIENLPLVVNLSLGAQTGAHDGSEPMEIALDELAASPGRAVVVAAGNDAQTDIHVRAAVVEEGHPVVFRLRVPETDVPFPSLVLDFWHSGSSRVVTQVVTPSGVATTLVGAAGPVGLDDYWTPDGLVDVLASEEPDPLNGLLRTLVALRGEAGEPLAAGVWQIIFAGQAKRIDGWVGEASLGGPWPRFLNHLDATDLVGPPATGLHVIAVGAYVSRTGWTDAQGNSRAIQGEEGKLAYFSSPGPTRDGRMKPEVTAPGMAIGAALSRDSDPRQPVSIFYAAGSERNVLEDRLHAISSGTSMASPLVAGAAALLLERNPSLDGTRIRDMFSVSTRTDDDTGLGALFCPPWGFGRMDASRLVKVLTAWSSGSFDPTQSLCGAAQPWLSPAEGESVLVAAIPRDNRGMALGPGHPVSIEARGAGFSGPLQDPGSGIYYRALSGPGQRGSDAEVTCRFGGEAFEARPTVRLAADYGEFQGSGVTGGACQCGRGQASSSILLVLMFLVLAARRRTRP